MSQEPSTVTYSLEEVLKRIEDKIDRHSETTATSIQTLENKLGDRINKLENKLDDSVNKLDDGINKLENKLDDSVNKLENKLDDRINKLENKLDGKIDHIENRLESKINQLDDKIDRQSEEITTIKATLKAQQPLFEKIPDLTEKVGELKNWRQIVFIVVTATVSGLVGWLIRGGALKP